MLHYDGNKPYGFTSSEYKTDKPAFTAAGSPKEPETRPFSLLTTFKRFIEDLSRFWLWIERHGWDI